MNLEIRGRSRVLGWVTVASAAVAVGYGWRAVAQGSPPASAVAVLLLAVAVAHLVAYLDARRPTLVADDLGIRIRAGGSWWGLRWSDVATVDVRPRRGWSDGVVAVAARDGHEPRPTSRRQRWALTARRLRYGSELVVSYGVMTSPRNVAVVGALEELAGAKVHVRGRDVVLPSTVEVSAPVDTTADAMGDASGRGQSGEGDSDDRESGGQLGDAPHGESSSESSSVRSGASLSALRSVRRTGRRTDLTFPVRAQPAVTGNLALARRPADEPSDLPEIDDLVRGHGGGGDGGRVVDDSLFVDRGKNVGLIIDETTELSARAMARTRRPVARGLEARSHAASGWDDERTKAGPTGGGQTGGGQSGGEQSGGEQSGGEQSGGGQSGIVVSPGAELAHARRLLGVSVDGLADRTRIRPHVIECLEANDFSPCGGDVYARGHIKMLAGALGVNPEPLVRAYDDTYASAPVRARQVFEADLASSGLIRGGSDGPKWGALVAVVLVLVIVWTVARYVTEDAGPSTDQNSPLTNTQPLGSPGAGNLPLRGPLRAAALIRASGGDATVTVTDRYGQRVFRGRLTDGQHHRVAGVAPLTVVASNGAVVAIRAYGRNLGPIAAATTDPATGQPVVTRARATVRARR